MTSFAGTIALYVIVLCTIYEASNGLRINRDALKSGVDLDFVDPTEQEALKHLRKLSESTLQSALQKLHHLQNVECSNKATLTNCTSDRLIRERSVLDPKDGCMWLRTSHVEREGLGHTFSSWAFYLSVAIDNKLTYYAPFYTAAHQTSNHLLNSSMLFGFHGTFFWARQPQRPKFIDIGLSRKDCRPEDVNRAVTMYRNGMNNATSSSCPVDVVFVCHNEHDDFQRRFIRSAAPILRPLKASFRAGYDSHMQYYLSGRQEVRGAKKAGDLVIVAHIRRGDILRSRRVDREHRLVSLNVYIDLLHQLLIEISKYFSATEGEVAIYFLCEGAPDAFHVVEYSPRDPHVTYFVNVSFALAPFCNNKNHCSVQVMAHANVNEAFVAMAEADILITSRSGFPWMAAALSDPPLVIAFPLGATSYDGISNVIYPVAKKGFRLWESKSGVVEIPNLTNAVQQALRKRKEILAIDTT